jgi:hypothetical protein
MQEERKKIIRYALDYNIADIHTYPGYKGDLIVRITIKERDDVISIRKFALSLGIKEVVIKEKKDVKLYEMYCITEDEGVYHIKDVDGHPKKIYHDIWANEEE